MNAIRPKESRKPRLVPRGAGLSGAGSGAAALWPGSFGRSLSDLRLNGARDDWGRGGTGHPTRRRPMRWQKPAIFKAEFEVPTWVLLACFVLITVAVTAFSIGGF